MPIAITTLTDTFSVTSQVSAHDLAEIRQLGFRSVINNRPDGEDIHAQPSQQSLKEAADELGLNYAHLPLKPNGLNDDIVAEMRQLLATLPTPILAFCRSGGRSSQLYRAAISETVPSTTNRNNDDDLINVGGADRVIRFVVGMGLVTATLAGAIGSWGWIGLLPISTALLRICPSYMLFGINTCPIKK